MEDFLTDWGYLGIFLGILATGLGFPMPEELPVVIGGALAGTGHAYWWVMLPVCIVGVIVGDSFLYLIGRFWGTKLVELPFIKKNLLSPERLDSIRGNFQKYGVKILLFARLTPGIRAPIFITAGISHLPLVKFLVADGIYAIPGVSILFLMGFWFTDSMVGLIQREAEHAKSIIILVVLAALTIYLIYRHLRKPVVTGGPEEMPPVVAQATTTIDHTLEVVKERILHPSHPHIEIKCGDGAKKPENGSPPGENCQGAPKAEGETSQRDV